MESELVKEIKKLIDCDKKQNELGGIIVVNRQFLIEVIALINELESENERLVKELEDMPIPFMGCMLENQLLSDISKEKNGEIKALKDRIAELEKENKDYHDRFNNAQTYIDNHEEIWKLNTEIKLKQFAEMMKEKVKDYEALTYKNNEVTYHNLELELDETLKECLKV